MEYFRRWRGYILANPAARLTAQVTGVATSFSSMLFMLSSDVVKDNLLPVAATGAAAYLVGAAIGTGIHYGIRRVRRRYSERTYLRR